MRILILLCLTVIPLQAGFHPFGGGTTTPRLDSVLARTWNGIKKRNIDSYPTGLAHRPKSEQPGDAVSEGAGYGMLVALFVNDQRYFNSIWDAAEKRMWNGSFYDWRVDRAGTVIASGAASDAEQDIALALIFADLLVEKGYWSAHTSPRGATYDGRARDILRAIRTLMVDDGRYFAPGSGWGGREFVNPGYFAPAFYRVFEAFDSSQGSWMPIIDQCYRSIEASAGYQRGLAPDWMTPQGQPTGDALGYNSYAGGEFTYKDGIRTLWRIATDWLWFRDPRAERFCRNAIAFLDSPRKANFFRMDGSAVTGAFELGNGVTRPRAEHSHLTIAMWACAALADTSASLRGAFNDELLSYYHENADFFGRVNDSSGEDTLHNEMYFDQFLAWFGLSLTNGNFYNMYAFSDDPDPAVPARWLTAPSLDTNVINADITPLRVKAAANKTLGIALQITDTTGAVVFSDYLETDTLNYLWYGLSMHNGWLAPGKYVLTLTTPRIATPARLAFWLGRSKKIFDATSVLVDDFSDNRLQPFVGTWTSYVDRDDNSGGQSTVTTFALGGAAPDRWLTWHCKLDKGRLAFDPYAALEWQAPEQCSFCARIDTIIVECRADRACGVSLQVITGDITDYNYFHDSLYLSTQWKTFRIPVTELRQRWGGDRRLDLSSTQAIRWQVQGTTATQYHIEVRHFAFAGRFSGVEPPPPYTEPPPDFLALRRDLASPAPFQLYRTGRRVHFGWTNKRRPVRVALHSLSGRLISAWRGADSNLNVITLPATPGIYTLTVVFPDCTQTIRITGEM